MKTNMPTNFSEQIYKQLKKVPKGRVTTYKALAESLNSKAYRAVGTAMKNNPNAPHVPCHRVVSANGLVGGFKGQKSGESISEKIILLRNEEIEIVGGRVKDFQKVLFDFKK